MSTSFANTKIVATVGPASNTKEKLLELIVAGVSVFRLNFSHGKHEDHLKVIEHIRELNKTFDYNVSILQDLQGPKIRIGEVENGAVPIKEGDPLLITTEKVVGTSEKVSCSYTALASDVKAGDNILIDDGNLQLRVESIDDQGVHTKVIYGGMLKSRKGVNLPDTDISEPSLTKKDKEDLAFGMEQDVDWIALSFVRSAGDIINLRNILNQAGKHARIIAKIERPEAIDNIEAIVAEVDAIMVARGDLGVEVQMEDVPMLQKRIVQLCNHNSKPVIIATQMMESMIEKPRPTRAEAGDVANAVLDGADAVMLSAETASGKYPVQTIQAMTKIIMSVERQAQQIYHKYYELDPTDPDFKSTVIVESACRMASTTNSKALVGITTSGFTAYKIARHRPEADIFIFTPNKKLLNILSLVWGVRAYYYNKRESTDGTFADLKAILIKEGHLRKGDLFINTGSMPVTLRRRTNMMKISVVE